METMTINVRHVNREAYYKAMAQAKLEHKTMGKFISEALAEKVDKPKKS